MKNWRLIWVAGFIAGGADVWAFDHKYSWVSILVLVVTALGILPVAARMGAAR